MDDGGLRLRGACMLAALALGRATAEGGCATRIFKGS